MIIVFTSKNRASYGAKMRPSEENTDGLQGNNNEPTNAYGYMYMFTIAS